MDTITRKLAWVGGSELIVETGRLARQADGSVLLRFNDTVMLATVVAKKDIDPNVDFLPLTVDYKETYASTGKYPGGFFKRDGRLNEYEILTSRLIDRTLRPMFPEDYHGDIQMIVTLYSSDMVDQPDALATFAASCALMASDIPFPDPVAAVRVGLIGETFVINPTFEQMAESRVDMMVSGTLDSIVMVEGEMDEISEREMVQALRTAHEAIKKLCQFQLELRSTVGKTFRDYAKPLTDETVVALVNEHCAVPMREITSVPKPKQERSQAYKLLKESLSVFLKEKLGDAYTPEAQRIAKAQFDDLQFREMRRMIIEDGIRLDGRTTDVVRPIWCEVGVLPRPHGSAIFTRGETQSLTTVTLGTKLDEQTIDYATSEGSKKFILQYNFPPFSTGESKPQRGPSRREIGHGNLAERALKRMVPETNEYTLRVVSDVLESNGSSSMATVCAGSLALLHAGVKLKGSVSGIAMGLIMEEDGRYAILSDILGDEDHLGDMDFKVAGTSYGITACQMDIKIRGLNFEVLEKALDQASRGRAHILDCMNQVMPEASPDYSEYAPRLIKFEIPSDTIGAVIGTGGKIIQEIQRATSTTISIEEYDGKGHVTIASPDRACLEAAEAWIKSIIVVPEVGGEYLATVKFVKDIGLVVEYMPGKEAFVHISEIAWERTADTSAFKPGDQFMVTLTEVDPKGSKVRASRKALLPKPEGFVERPAGDRGGYGDRGPRRDDRGGYGDRGPRRDGGDRGGYGDRGPRRDDRGGGDRGPRRDGDGGNRGNYGGYGDRGPRPNSGGNSGEE